MTMGCHISVMWQSIFLFASCVTILGKNVFRFLAKAGIIPIMISTEAAFPSESHPPPAPAAQSGL
jgi:hypothetical protein